MPDFLSHDLSTLRERVATLARGPLAALRDDAALAPADLAAQVRGLSKEACLFGLLQDTSTPALTVLVVRETLARHNVGHLAGLFGPPAGLLAGVAEPLRSSHLLPMLAGDKRSGFAFTEPADAPRPSWAVVDGDSLLVSGRKSYVTGGADADFLVALVDVEGQGPAMVVIDTALPGVTLTRRFGSLDGSHHAAFAFLTALETSFVVAHGQQRRHGRLAREPRAEPVEEDDDHGDDAPLGPGLAQSPGVVGDVRLAAVDGGLPVRLHPVVDGGAQVLRLLDLLSRMVGKGHDSHGSRCP